VPPLPLLIPEILDILFNVAYSINMETPGIVEALARTRPNVYLLYETS
jgi:hypothetical protein